MRVVSAPLHAMGDIPLPEQRGTTRQRPADIPGGHHGNRASRRLPCQAQQGGEAHTVDMLFQRMRLLVAEVIDGQLCTCGTADQVRIRHLERQA